jgi:hypothetical protein
VAEVSKPYDQDEDARSIRLSALTLEGRVTLSFMRLVKDMVERFNRNAEAYIVEEGLLDENLIDWPDDASELGVITSQIPRAHEIEELLNVSTTPDSDNQP